MKVKLNDANELVIHFDNSQERRAVLALSRMNITIPELAEHHLCITENCLGQIKNFLHQTSWALSEDNLTREERITFEKEIFGKVF